MKLLFVSVISIFSLGASAQTFETKLPKISLGESLEIKKNKHNYFPLLLINKDSFIKEFKVFTTRQKGNKIKNLKLDNMPCIVPDTKDIVAIPNAWPNVVIPFRGTIPNPALRYPLNEFYLKNNGK